MNSNRSIAVPLQQQFLTWNRPSSDSLLSVFLLLLAGTMLWAPATRASIILYSNYVYDEDTPAYGSSNTAFISGSGFTPSGSFNAHALQFTPTKSGVVDTVRVPINAINPAHPQPIVNLMIIRDNDGVPDADIIIFNDVLLIDAEPLFGASVIAGADAGPFGLTATSPHGDHLDEGTPYWLLAWTMSANASFFWRNDRSGEGGNTPWYYTAGGSDWLNSTPSGSRDSRPAFEISMIPEPSTALLAGVGLVLVSLTWRRRRLVVTA